MQHLTGIGESAIAGRTVEQRFAYFVLQLAHHLAYSRLGPANDLGRAGKAARLDDGQKGFQLKEIHKKHSAVSTQHSVPRQMVIPNQSRRRLDPQVSANLRCDLYNKPFL